jgi:RimJ/RimL family protein N-acetyltransferase
VSLRLRGDTVALRPFRDDEVGRLVEVQETWSSEDGVHGTGRLTEAQLTDRIAASGTWTDGRVGLLLAIEADGRLVGEIQARGERSQLLPPGVFELGIELYDRTDRGKGTGRAALGIITRHLFEDEHANRVQLSTDVDNVAMRRAAERAGFRFEGVMRSFWPVSDGEPRDYALFGRTRSDHQDRGDG